jgi:hypothetical protein
MLQWKNRIVGLAIASALIASALGNFGWLPPIHYGW